MDFKIERLDSKAESTPTDHLSAQSPDEKLPEKLPDVSESAVLDERPSRNPFLDPKVAEHYRGVYEDAKYECRHVFDPAFEWEPKEEKKIIRMLDWRVTAWSCVMFFALQVDRKNLSQALSDNFLTDLHLTTDQYNFGNIIFRFSFLLAELPSQLVSKKLGPDRWIPAQMIIWSIVAACQADLQGKTSFYATRSLLGLLQGGFIPDIVLWLSYFYTSSELPIRLSFFWTTLDLTAIAAAFMAYGLLHLEGVAGLAGWRWLFLIEGLITFTIGVAAWFLMPASAVSTKAWYRPNGWFTDREEKIVVNRVLRDDPSKGDMNNRMPITPRRLWKALSDYDLWPIYLIGLIVYVPAGPEDLYFTLTLRNLGYSTFTTNLLTIPSAVVSVLTLIGLTWVSERVRQRAFVAVIQNLWILPCIIALRWWPGSETNSWGTWALITVLLAYPYAHAIVVGWASRNSNSVRTRSVSAACYNMMVQTGDIISASVYEENDAPLYHRGNTVLFALNILAIALFLFTKWYYVQRNKYREKRWNAMTAEQQKDYVENTTDEGNKRLDFRFVH